VTRPAPQIPALDRYTVSPCKSVYRPLARKQEQPRCRPESRNRASRESYLYTLDDSNQGPNATGLRNQVWEVSDTGQPGFGGMPDGQLNMNGSSWEIEFATSAEAKPTLLIP
jgi:hypothetical protein